MLPKKPIHPGAILKEIYLNDMQLTQTELAQRMGCTLTKVNEIINGKRAMTAAFALDVSQVLGTSPELWLGLQLDYDLYVEKKKRKAA